VIDDQLLQDLASFEGRLSSDDPLVRSFNELHDSVAAIECGDTDRRSERALPSDPDLEGLDDRVTSAENVAARSLSLSNERVLPALSVVAAAWTPDDNDFVRQLTQRYGTAVAEAEANILLGAGVTPSAIAQLLSAASIVGAPDSMPPDPDVSHAQTQALAEQLQRQTMQDDYDERRKERRFIGRMKRLGRAIHVVGGGVLLLADVGAFAAAAVANPFAGIAGGAVAVVSIKKGSDLIRLGVSDDFGNPKPTQKREETHHEQ
jgi:hypothetical protein